MAFRPIDYQRWARREYFECFRCTAIYMTVQLDITDLYGGLKARGLRLYPALVHCAARAVNEHPEFRYGYDEERNIGIWDTVHPCYTLPRRDNPELFAMKCTDYDPDFSVFYERFTADYALAESCGRLLCDETQPPNICGVSIAPGIHYSSFSFGGDAKADFAPFTLFGQFRREGERVLLPVSGEFSHAVNDGVHISRFFAAIEAAAGNLF